MEPVPQVFFGGEFVPAKEARVGIMTHALHYGTAIFEGIRGNWNADTETFHVFRPYEHYHRFLQGCKLLRISVPYDEDQLVGLTVELINRNSYRQDIYIRPIAFKSSERVAVLRLQELDDNLAIFAIPFGPYLDVDSLASCSTSSWRRMDDTVIPTRLKVAGVYVNSILAKTEATESGFDEAIMLNQDGHVSEGTGENIFLVMDGKLITPSTSDNILPGITRNTVIQLANQELEMETLERSVDRSELYLADEVFLSGTAAHLTPVGSIDHRTIGGGEIGPVTKELQRLYFDIIRGKNPKYLHWSTAVPARSKADRSEISSTQG